MAATELAGLVEPARRGGKFHSDRGDAPGWGERDYHGRLEAERHRRYAAVGHRIEELARRRVIRGIVLAGPAKDTAALIRFLPHRVAERLLGTVRLNPTSATITDVRTAAMAAAEDHDARAIATELRMLRETLGTGWTVDGPAETLRALHRGQVRTLFVQEEFEGQGYRCAGDRAPGARSGRLPRRGRSPPGAGPGRRGDRGGTPAAGESRRRPSRGHRRNRPDGRHPSLQVSAMSTISGSVSGTAASREQALVTPTLRGVLVPLDGSVLAEQALSVGAAIAKRAGVPLHLVTVEEPRTDGRRGGCAGCLAVRGAAIPRTAGRRHRGGATRYGANRRARGPGVRCARDVRRAGEDRPGRTDDPRSRRSRPLVARKRRRPAPAEQRHAAPAAAPERAAPAHRLRPNHGGTGRRDRPPRCWKRHWPSAPCGRARATC